MKEPAPELGSSLPCTTPDGEARLAALRSIAQKSAAPTSIVGYRSQGKLLLIGPEADALEQAESLRDGLSCVILATLRAEATAPSLPVRYGEVVSISGHLGQFDVIARERGQEVNLATTLGWQYFDLVLDLSEPPTIRTELLPPGYYAPDADREALDRAMSELPEMVGEFQKPKYFDYDPSICAHGERGLSGCTRCIEACPSEAITSLGERISVDPYLCHGAGSCASVCPTGAIKYAYPSPSDTGSQLRTLLRTYRERWGRRPALLFHDDSVGLKQVSRVALRLPENVIPVRVEDIGYLGLDVWLFAIAHGASSVLLLATSETPASVRDEIERQIEYANAVLQALHMDPLISLLGGEEDALLRAIEAAGSAEPVADPARFGAFDEKRTTLGMALDYLYERAVEPADWVRLPAGAPFGEVIVDKESCTLCMACVAVCPASALAAGADSPRLSFQEWNCVQCGLCERACPENAITRDQRILLEPGLRNTMRVLNEESPFLCVACGKPFATQSVIRRMTERLREHHMFQGDNIKRLQMCEECRVKDMFLDR